MITYKNSAKIKVRRKVLQQIAKELSHVLKNDSSKRVVLVHGAGSAGHVLARKYDLKKGVNGDKQKLKAALKIRENNQKLNAIIIKILTNAGLPVVPLHTGSVIAQSGGEIEDVNYDMVDMALKEGCVPVMYGEMAFDSKLGLSVCSGDEIVSQLADYLRVSKIIYASDIDGIYDLDPYKHRHAKLLQKISLPDLVSGNLVDLGESHSIDVTGGLFNKIRLLDERFSSNILKQVVVMNGLKKGNFKKSLQEDSVGTLITL